MRCHWVHSRWLDALGRDVHRVVVGERRAGRSVHLPELGCTSDEWWRAIRTGRWALEGPRVLRSLSAPRTDAQRLLAATLDAGLGAVLHAETALGWQGMPGFDLRRLKIARPYGSTSSRPVLAELHKLRRIRACDVFVRDGVATETALRAVWAIAERYATEARHELGLLRIGRLLDTGNRLGLLSWAGLAASVDELRERGRAGTRLMRELSAARPPGSSFTETRQEEQLERSLAAAGDRALIRQVVVGGRAPIGRADFRDDELPAVIEVNSLTYHTTPSDRVADELRYRRLTEAGFAVGVVWEYDNWSRPSAAVNAVRVARAHAAEGRFVVVHSASCPWTPPVLGSVLCS